MENKQFTPKNDRFKRKRDEIISPNSSTGSDKESTPLNSNKQNKNKLRKMSPKNNQNRSETNASKENEAMVNKIQQLLQANTAEIMNNLTEKIREVIENTQQSINQKNDELYSDIKKQIDQKFAKQDNEIKKVKDKIETLERINENKFEKIEEKDNHREQSKFRNDVIIKDLPKMNLDEATQMIQKMINENNLHINDNYEIIVRKAYKKDQSLVIISFKNFRDKVNFRKQFKPTSDISKHPHTIDRYCNLENDMSEMQAKHIFINNRLDLEQQKILKMAKTLINAQKPEEKLFSKVFDNYEGLIYGIRNNNYYHIPTITKLKKIIENPKIIDDEIKKQNQLMENRKKKIESKTNSMDFESTTTQSTNSSHQNNRNVGAELA